MKENITINNKYQRRQRKEFYTKYENNEKVTDESQQAQASITEMAKKYGIEAIISKAMQNNIESLSLKDKLYGNDLTKGLNSKEQILGTKNKLNNLFEQIPAYIRKTQFNDDVMNFINAYTSADLKKLEPLNKIGLVSDTQINEVRKYQNEIQAKAKEELMRKQFIEKLETMKEGLYENYKTNGTITINNIEGNAGDNKTIL